MKRLLAFQRGLALLLAAILCSSVGLRAGVGEFQFVRSDVTDDGSVDVSDPIGILRHVFLGRPLTCRDSGDVNDDGEVDLSDSVWLLWFIFMGGEAPSAPFPGCGVDPTPDELGCDFSSSCPPVDNGLTSFVQFVLDLLGQTADTTDPVPVNDLEFEISDDPDVFEPLLER